MDKRTIRDLGSIRGKKVFVRVDFNVPLNENRQITDDTRIRAALPTIRFLIEGGAKVILASHMGRPKGQVNEKYSLKPCAQRLTELLGQEVVRAADCIGPEVKAQVDGLADGQVLLLENVRFYAQEEKNDPDFAKSLAELAEIFVNDAFGTAHRAHASTAGIAQYLPAVAGFLMDKEISVMGKALKAPEKPFVAIMGGAKIADKIPVMKNLLDKVDALVIGGGMANTFLKAQGKEVGKSLCETDKLELAQEILAEAEKQGVAVYLPSDAVVAGEFAAGAANEAVSVDAIPGDKMALDIGPASVVHFAKVIGEAKTVIWNGPMGAFEIEPFDKGTVGVAQAMAEVQGTTIIGGGDSVAAVEKAGLADRMTHISTGGGASLEFLEGRDLPGVAVLQDK